MNDDFPRVRESFMDSVIGRVFAAVTGAAQSAWRTSATRSAARSLVVRVETMPRAGSIANIAATVAIAAGLQPLLMLLMPRTVVPALPWPVFAIIAVFAAAVAWQAEAFAGAWQDSRLARWIRR